MFRLPPAEPPDSSAVFQTTIKACVPTVQDAMCELAKEDKSVSSPNRSHLLAIALALPVATAECERGFGTMKRIKMVLSTTILSLMVAELSRRNTSYLE
jgi:hypothetical protein